MRMHATVLAAASLCGLIAGGGVALADENGRYLSDPAWLPMQGQVFGSTEFSVAEGRGSTYDSTGALASHFYDQSDRIGQTLEYGLTDDLTIRLQDSWLPFDKRTRTLVGGGFNSRESSGVADPSLGLTWRLIDQADHGSPMNLDLFGSYSPDWLGSHSATAISSGNEGRGGQAGDIGLAISDVMPAFTLYGSTSVSFTGQRDTFNPATGLTAVRDSTTDWHLDLDSQYRASDVLSFNAGIGETIGRGHTRVTSGSGVERFDDAGNVTALTLAANYAFAPESVVGSLTYVHDFDGTSHTLFPATPADDTTTRGRQQNLWGARLDYVFP